MRKRAEKGGREGKRRREGLPEVGKCVRTRTPDPNHLRAKGRGRGDVSPARGVLKLFPTRRVGPSGTASFRAMNGGDSSLPSVVCSFVSCCGEKLTNIVFINKGNERSI